MIEIYSPSIVSDVTSGILSAIWVVGAGETASYLILGRPLKQAMGDYGLVTYIFSRSMTIWYWVGFCFVVDGLWFATGGASLTEVVVKLGLLTVYPSVMEMVVEFIWKLDDQE